MRLGPRNMVTRVVDAWDVAKTSRGKWAITHLGFAWNGLRAAWREECGFRNHVIGALAMVTTLVILRPEPIWWAVAFLCSALLMALELINSAIERLIDHVDRRLHPEIKLIKDMSAASVVVAAAGVFLMGLVMILDTLRWLA